MESFTLFLFYFFRRNLNQSKQKQEAKEKDCFIKNVRHLRNGLINKMSDKVDCKPVKVDM